MYFQLKKPVVVHLFANILLQMLNSLTKKWKEKSPNVVCTFYTKHTDKFTSLKHNLLTKANTARGKGLLEIWRHNFRHLQPSCSSCAAVLLVFLEDIAQNYSSYLSHIPEILLSYFYRSKGQASDQVAWNSSETMRASCKKRGLYA